MRQSFHSLPSSFPLFQHCIIPAFRRSQNLAGNGRALTVLTDGAGGLPIIQPHVSAPFSLIGRSSAASRLWSGRTGSREPGGLEGPIGSGIKDGPEAAYSRPGGRRSSLVA